VIFSLHPPGGEYKERKGGIKMEDYIDFPCSDNWLGYYYERGLTPRNPKPFDKKLKMKIKELEEENNRLRQMLSKQQKPTYKKLPENNLDKF
jgi:hypothetical protein